MLDLYKYARPLLLKLDAEKAHRITLAALKTGLVPPVPAVTDPALKVTLWNRVFPNPVGLAAGFDKNAEVIGPMFGFGFGFIEAGTVTPKPQIGNPRPRVFRDQETNSVINRMGFPNEGLNRFKVNLQSFLERKPRAGGIVGINIGMNKSQTDPAKDYSLLLEQLGPFADYIAINISSPNTPGLRDLQERGAFTDLIGRIMKKRKECCGINPPPLLVKLAPDLGENQLGVLAAAILDSGLDGVILTNTTTARPAPLEKTFAAQKGGLSGPLLKDASTAMIRRFYALTRGKVPIIGLGGISSGADAYEKIKAGATLVQLYTALVFQGPDVVQRINSELLQFMKRDGFSHITEAVGADHDKKPKK